MGQNSDHSSTLSLNLSEIIDDIFMVLSDKEREVVVKRFSLDNKGKQTLESIGQRFNVTRERIRQIQKIALSKLRRTVNSTKLKYIHELSVALLKENGGIMTEKELVSQVLDSIEKTLEVDQYIVRLSLAICPEINSIEKNNLYEVSWHLVDISQKQIKEALKAAHKALKTEKKLMTEASLVQTVKKENPKLDVDFLRAVFTIDCRMKEVDGSYGLMTWRHINPKSIRDKALIILRQEKKPLHFRDIAKKIEGAEFDQKRVTIQAVHNDLIRYEEFVLVGRGLYALKEWGYEEGTVTDVIEALLRKKSPMSKQEIIDEVLRQRHVKRGTISLNLQKNPQFVRVGRAVYALDESKS